MNGTKNVFKKSDGLVARINFHIYIFVHRNNRKECFSVTREVAAAASSQRRFYIITTGQATLARLKVAAACNTLNFTTENLDL